PNNGGQTAIDNIFTGTNAESQVRSAYLLVDDLPYATYVMYGLYRPMFGHMTPDHTTLLNNLLTADNRNGGHAYNDFRADSAKMIHRALTIGGSPNVPFANIHYIMPIEDETFLSKYALARDRGFALNLGGRFVTLGASFMLSWWSTEGPREAGGVNLKTDMIG